MVVNFNPNKTTDEEQLQKIPIFELISSSNRTNFQSVQVENRPFLFLKGLKAESDQTGNYNLLIPFNRCRTMLHPIGILTPINCDLQLIVVKERNARS